MILTDKFDYYEKNTINLFIPWHLADTNQTNTNKF